MKDNSSFQYDTLSLESQRNDEISLLERHDLLTGEPRYIEDEIRNSKFAMIFGGLAGVACLIAAILSWILYHRDRRSITLWHAIMATVGCLIGFLVAGWGAGAGSNIAKGQPPSSGMTFLAFAGSLIFAVYMAGAALWLTLYKPTHLCRISSWTSSTDEWNRHMPDNWSLAKAWTRDRRLLNWIIALAAIAAFCFAFCAYATWTVAYNRFKFASYALYLSCLGLIIFGFLMVYWSEEALEWHKYGENARYNTFNTKFLKALGIAGIVIGALAIITRFIRNRTGFFVLGMLSLILFILTICCAGLLLRNVWQHRTDGNPDATCQGNLAAIHQDEIAPRWCPNKYLASGTTCTKADATLLWEDGTNANATLNPACCKCVKEYYIWPYYILGIYALLFALCAAIAAASLFYLSDNSDNYGVNKVNDGLDFAFLGLALLCCIGFGLYFIFRKPNVAGSTNASYKAFTDPNFTDPNFERVHDSVIADAAANAPQHDGYYKWSTAANPTPAFDNASTTCSDPNTCVIRAAVLAKNAQIIKGDLGGAQEGGANTRLQFFPDCTANTSDYLYVFGTETQVATALSNLKFAITDLSNPNPDVTFNTDQ